MGTTLYVSGQYYNSVHPSYVYELGTSSYPFSNLNSALEVLALYKPVNVNTPITISINSGYDSYLSRKYWSDKSIVLKGMIPTAAFHFTRT